MNGCDRVVGRGGFMKIGGAELRGHLCGGGVGMSGWRGWGCVHRSRVRVVVVVAGIHGAVVVDYRY